MADAFEVEVKGVDRLSQRLVHGHLAAQLMRHRHAAELVEARSLLRWPWRTEAVTGGDRHRGMLSLEARLEDKKNTQKNAGSEV